MSSELSNKVRAWVEKKVGGKAVARPRSHRHAKDDKCFVLVDEALEAAGAKSARDFADGGIIRAGDDYVWGTEVEVGKVQPGDVLQFRDHVVVTKVEEMTEKGSWEEREVWDNERPHHTAVVVEVREDGTVVVAEQNVRPRPNRVSRNEIARLAAGEEVRRVSRNRRHTITVTGSVTVYRPVPKIKGAMLHLEETEPVLESRRRFAHFTPAAGGFKRRGGPLGLA